jgi:hypothetical protein
VDVSHPLCKRGERLSVASTYPRHARKEMTMPTKPPIVRCRYTFKYLRCAEPAVDPTGEVLLCAGHLDLTRELIKRLDRNAS